VCEFVKMKKLKLISVQQAVKMSSGMYWAKVTSQSGNLYLRCWAFWCWFQEISLCRS